MFLVAAYGATGARWLFLGGIGALSAWSELDETVFGGRELGWIVIVIGFAGAILVAIDRTAAGRVAPD